MKIDNILPCENLPDELVIEASRIIEIRCIRCWGKSPSEKSLCTRCKGSGRIRRTVKLRLYVATRHGLLRKRFILAEDGFSGQAKFTEARAIDSLVDTVLLMWSVGIRPISADIRFIEEDQE